MYRPLPACVRLNGLCWLRARIAKGLGSERRRDGAVPRLSVFIACSLDGYIADAGGSLDWLDAAAASDEDYGYEAFIADVDALAMGRATYDFIAHLDPLPFGDRPLYVFTTRPPQPRDGITFWSPTPDDAVRAWAEAGHRRIYVDGGHLISRFLSAGLIDDMCITVVPQLLGGGHRLFHDGIPPSAWRLTGVQHWPSGMANLTYVRTGS